MRVPRAMDWRLGKNLAFSQPDNSFCRRKTSNVKLQRDGENLECPRVERNAYSQRNAGSIVGMGKTLISDLQNEKKG